MSLATWAAVGPQIAASIHTSTRPAIHVPSHRSIHAPTHTCTPSPRARGRVCVCRTKRGTDVQERREPEPQPPRGSDPGEDPQREPNRRQTGKAVRPPGRHADLLQMAPKASAGALDPCGSPSLILVLPIHTYMHTHITPTPKIYSPAPNLYLLRLNGRFATIDIPLSDPQANGARTNPGYPKSKSGLPPATHTYPRV